MIKKRIYIWWLLILFLSSLALKVSAQVQIGTLFLGTTPENPLDLGRQDKNFFLIDREIYCPSGYEQNFVNDDGKMRIYTCITFLRPYYVEFMNEINTEHGVKYYIQMIVRNSNKTIIHSDGYHGLHNPSYNFDPGVYYIDWIVDSYQHYEVTFFGSDICGSPEGPVVDVPPVSDVPPITMLSNQNYVLTKRPRVPTSSANSISDNNVLESCRYFDGIGRPIQQVDRHITPSGKDIVTVQEYDISGRELGTWLPIPYATQGNCMSTSIVRQARTFYADQYPYSELVYEKSPLNRMAVQYGAGSSWRQLSKGVTFDYTANQVCARYVTTDIKTSTSISRSGNYATNELFVTSTTDEDGHIVYEVKDMQGRTVLTRQMSGTMAHDTHYVYDSFGNLRAVIPPEASARFTSGTWTESTEALKQYLYLYHYDERNRCIAKKLPGAEWVYYIYDKADRLIFTQDGTQRPRGEWTFSIPDALGRTALTGTCNNALNHLSQLNSSVITATWTNTTGAHKGYEVSGISLSVTSYLTVNYYDNYDFMGKNGIPAINDSNFQYEQLSGYGTRYTGSYKGLHTGMLTAQLEGTTGVNTWLPTVMYYDYQGRVIQVKSKNHLSGGIEKEYVGYTFTGHPQQKMHIHSATGKTTQTEYYTYIYDHADRLTKVEHQLKAGTVLNAKVTLAEYAYDELGRMLTKRPHGSTTNQLTYAYNIRSWLTDITGNRFTQHLYYNTGNGMPCYNGNVSSMTWKAGTESVERGYKFTYDGLNRLTEAAYGEGANIASNPNRFTEKVTSYDKHGNIKALQRYGKTSASAYGLIDNLTFGYVGNRMKYVNDAVTTNPVGQTFHFVDGTNSTGDEYLYDANGNLTKDSNKNITNIQYNSLNLPKKVELSGSRSATYMYDAAGVKRQVSHQGGGVNKTTDYCGNVVYENGALSKILTEEGYITLSGTAPTYHYYLQDHLGNNRVVINSAGTVQQVNHYYPFGGLFDQTAETVQPYKFGGKELDRTYGIDLYDYSARYMDGALGRFTTMDPLAEKYYSISPYVYCANNPMRYVDPTGMDWYSYEEEYEDKKGNIQTRTKYRYVQGTMSAEDMAAGGYTHLGQRHITDNAYYSLGGGIIEYDKFDITTISRAAYMMKVDEAAIAAINAAEGAVNFWGKYNNLISTGSDVATVLGEYMDASKGFKGTVTGVGVILAIPKLISDIQSFQSGDLHGVALMDAAANVLSVAGPQGAAASLLYTGAKQMAKGIQHVDTEAQRILKPIIYNPYRW